MALTQVSTEVCVEVREQFRWSEGLTLLTRSFGNRFLLCIPSSCISFFGGKCEKCVESVLNWGYAPGCKCKSDVRPRENCDRVANPRLSAQLLETQVSDATSSSLPGVGHRLDGGGPFDEPDGGDL